MLYYIVLFYIFSCETDFACEVDSLGVWESSWRFSAVCPLRNCVGHVGVRRNCAGGGALQCKEGRGVKSFGNIEGIFGMPNGQVIFTCRWWCNTLKLFLSTFCCCFRLDSGRVHVSFVWWKYQVNETTISKEGVVRICRCLKVAQKGLWVLDPNNPPFWWPGELPLLWAQLCGFLCIDDIFPYFYGPKAKSYQRDVKSERYSKTLRQYNSSDFKHMILHSIKQCWFLWSRPFSRFFFHVWPGAVMFFWMLWGFIGARGRCQGWNRQERWLHLRRLQRLIHSARKDGLNG